MTKRNYSVDLFRVIATFFVIILHVLGQGGILRNTSPNSISHWVAWFLEIGAFCAVDCFALITGYVMANKRIKLKNIINLWFEVIFYSLLISILFFAFLPETRTIKYLFYAVLPIMNRQWWYISSYFALFFFIPLINIALNHISRQTYKKILLVVLVGVCFIDCIIPSDPFEFNSGYSPVWLVLLYLFGAYIKIYNLEQKITASKSILVFFAMIILTFLSKLTINFATTTILGYTKYDNIFVSYISVTIVLSAIFMFLFCLNTNINDSLKRVISLFAPATLGVYLIHVHPFVFQYIMRDAFIALTQKSLIIMVVGVLIATFSIFLICSAIDLIRIQFFKLIKLGKLCEIIDNKITLFYLKVFKE